MNIIDSDSGWRAQSQPVRHSATTLKPAALKARLAKILSASGVKAPEDEDAPSHFTFGVNHLDQGLRGNALQEGLPCAALHEMHSAEKPDATSAAAMALLLAERCRIAAPKGQQDRTFLWISETGQARRQGKLYPPGLAELGIDPARIIHVDAPDSIAVLRAAADGVRSPAMSAVIVELAGRKPKGLDLTATRRLSLSAQRSGVLTLLLRSGGDAIDNPMPTAAFSRWSVAAAPSVALEANASGQPAFDMTLLRHRSGLYGLKARVEWNRDDQSFRDITPEDSRNHNGEQTTGARAPDTGAVSAIPALRETDPDAKPDTGPDAQAA